MTAWGHSRIHFNRYFSLAGLELTDAQIVPLSPHNF